MQSGDKWSNDEIPENAQEVGNNDYQMNIAVCYVVMTGNLEHFHKNRQVTL